MNDTDRARQATEWLVDNAPRIAQAKYALVKAESMLRVTKSLAMAHSGQKAISAQERDAYTSQQYLDAVEAHAKAAGDYEELRAMKDAAQARIEFWRSMNANQRAAEKGYGSAQ